MMLAVILAVTTSVISRRTSRTGVAACRPGLPVPPVLAYSISTAVVSSRVLLVSRMRDTAVIAATFKILTRLRLAGCAARLLLFLDTEAARVDVRGRNWEVRHKRRPSARLDPGDKGKFRARYPTVCGHRPPGSSERSR